MAVVVLIALAFCAGLSGSADAARGTPVRIEEYPSVAQVDFRGVDTGIWYHSCAGSILNIYYILSAANCFSGIHYNPNNRRIRVGSSKRNIGGTVKNVQTEFNHPSYGRNGKDADITVVRLLRPLVYNNTMRPATIIAQGAVFYGGLPVKHVGWGTTIQEGSASPMLLRNDIFIIDNHSCKERYEGLSIPEPVTENMMCVGFILDIATCLGDFGGPIFYNDRIHGNIVIGVGSWGHGCSNATFPAVTTSVASYTNWIIRTAV